MKWNKRKIILTLCTMAWMAFIFARSMRSAVQSTGESNQLLSLIRGIIPWLSDGALRKTAHFVEFAILGALLTETVRSFGKPAILLSLFLGLLTALCDETIQLFSEGRAGMVQDVWIDFAGIAFAVSAAALLRTVCRKRRKS